MLNLVSIFIGIVAFVLAFVGLIPLVGVVNWIAIPIAFVGLGIGALSSAKGGRNLNTIVLVVAVIRLFLGGGFL